MFIGHSFTRGVNTGMRLTTKFSAFVTLLTSLTIFVTLIGASLSFYNGIQIKMTNRVQAVATMLDNRLVSISFDQLEPQMDELMTPVEVVHVDFQLNGKSVYSHSRNDNYRPLGSSNQSVVSPCRRSSTRAWLSIWFIWIRWPIISARCTLPRRFPSPLVSWC